ncbi:MAG: N-succinylarginine dihydrolase [Hyphomonadaceae bacterium]
MEVVEYVEVHARACGMAAGWPACGLRIVATRRESAAAAQGFFLTTRWLTSLRPGCAADALSRRDYSDDLGDPALVDETQRALDELTRILLPGATSHPFQRA